MTSGNRKSAQQQSKGNSAVHNQREQEKCLLPVRAGLYCYIGVSLSMIKTYIIPTLTYGLKPLILKDPDNQPLEQYYKTLLQQIQHLPENTMTPAIYLLRGCIQLEGQIHIRILTFFRNILRRPNTIENYIIKRQLSTKDLSSNSRITQIRLIFHHYELPSA